MFTDKNNANQIMKVHSRGSLMEVLSSSFPIRKVQMNFRSYDRSNKVKDAINVYLDIDTILPLINSVKSGQFVQSFIQAKQTGVYKGQPINQYTSYFTDQGGTTKDGKVISRIFKIQESTKPGSWNLYAAEGPGKVTGTGLIQMNGRPTVFINVPVTNDQLITMMIKIEMHLQAYTNLIYSNFGNRIFTRVFSGSKEEEYTTYFYEQDKNASSFKNDQNNNYQNNNQQPVNNSSFMNNQAQMGYNQPGYHNPNASNTQYQNNQYPNNNMVHNGYR